MKPSQRKMILINRPFQLRFIFYSCSWMIGLSCTYLLLLSSLFNSFFQYLARDPLGPGITHLETIRVQLIWIVAGIQLALLVLMFLISLWVSHRIAGPLLRLRNLFHAVSRGQWSERLVFRKFDYFQDLAKDYNQMIEGIQQKFSQENQLRKTALSKVEQLLQKTPTTFQMDLKEIKALLESELEKKDE